MLACLRGLGATFADSRYMSAFFSVTPQQSLATGFTAYSAQSGLRDMSLNLGTRYRVDVHVAVAHSYTDRHRRATT